MNRKQMYRNRKILFGLGCLMASVVVLFLWDSFSLRQSAEEWTEENLENVANMVVYQTDQKLQFIMKDLREIAGAMGELDAAEQEYYLLHDAQSSVFNQIALVDLEGNAWFTDETTANLEDIPAFSEMLEKREGFTISLTETETVYMVPVYKEGNMVQMVAGVRDKEQIKDTLYLDTFGDQGVSFIIDKLTGDVVVPPADSIFTDKAGMIFDQSIPENQEVLAKMEADVYAGRSGNARFELDNEFKVLLNYKPLESCSWYVLTMVEEQQLNGNVQSYIFRNTIVMFISIVLLILVILLLRYFEKQNNREMEKQIFVDPLTGGMSNAKFLMEAPNYIQERPGGYYALVALDIREFRILNDIYGTKNGDKILRHLHKVLRERLKKGEMLSRGRADVFYMLLENASEEKMRARISDLSVAVNTYQVSNSMDTVIRIDAGIVVVENKKEELSSIQGRADIARRMRKSGRDGQERDSICTFYTHVEKDRMVTENEILRLMTPSLEKGEFKVYLQPKVRARTGKVVGAEALIRWQNPVRGFIYPDEFIPVFEKNGVLPLLDLFVFEEVCRVLQRWGDEGRELPKISVNLSRQHLMRKNFQQEFLDILHQYRVEPEYIELEITETTMFQQNEDTVKKMIGRIHQAGFHCSIDDFGSGYSSLGVLQSLEVDVLKMDRSFFQEGENWTRGQCVVRTVAELAENLGVESVAEGIETKRQIEFLKEVGCDLVQGYVFSKPLPIEEFEEFAYDGLKLKVVEARG